MWYLLGSAAAVAVGWVAATINLSGRAPVGILPIGVGLALGTTLSVLAALMRVPAAKRLWAGAALLAILAVLAEHAWLYGDFRRQWHAARAKSPQVAMFRPESPWTPVEYLAHEFTPGRAVLWTVDAALMIAATAGTVSLGQRASA